MQLRERGGRVDLVDRQPTTNIIRVHRCPQQPELHQLLFELLGVAMGYGILHMKPGPGTQVAAWCFWAGSGLLVLGGIRQMAKEIAAKRAAKRPLADVAVAVTVSMPSRSPTVQATTLALPDYCRQMI